VVEQGWHGCPVRWIGRGHRRHDGDANRHSSVARARVTSAASLDMSVASI
jgi:hypothetical protein